MKISTELIQEDDVINLQTSLHLTRPAVKNKLADQTVADHFLPLKALKFPLISESCLRSDIFRVIFCYDLFSQ